MKSNPQKLVQSRSFSILLLAAGLAIAFDLMPHINWHGADISKDVGLAFSLGVASSAFYFLLFTGWLEREMREHIEVDRRGTITEMAATLLPGFAPTQHFGLSNERDDDFIETIGADLDGSAFFYFSGLSGRVALVRLFRSKTSTVDNAVLKLPFTEKSLDSAVEILQKLTKVPKEKNKLKRPQTELTGMEGDRDDLYRLATSENSLDRRKYLTEIVYDSVLFAHYVARQHLKTIILRDWDEVTEFRIEMMSNSVFLGNYHPDLTRKPTSRLPFDFTRGTCRFDDTSFVWKLLYPSIRSQLKPSAQEVEILCDKARTSVEELFRMNGSLRGAKTSLPQLSSEAIRRRFESYIELLDKHSQQ